MDQEGSVHVHLVTPTLPPSLVPVEYMYMYLHMTKYAYMYLGEHTRMQNGPYTHPSWYALGYSGYRHYTEGDWVL